MIWFLATCAAAFFIGIALQERSIRRNDRCVRLAQERLEREIAERGDG